MTFSDLGFGSFPVVALLALNFEEVGQKHETQHRVNAVAQVRGSGGQGQGGSSGGGEE